MNALLSRLNITLREAALAFCLLAFFAGKIALNRFLPDIGLPLWLQEPRTPFLFITLVLSGLLARRQRLFDPAMLTHAWPLAAYCVFSIAYTLLPFPLLATTNIYMSIANFVLFAVLYRPECHAYLSRMITYFSAAIIVAAIMMTPLGEALLFAGGVKTLTMIAILSLFLLLMTTRGYVRIALLMLHGYALVAISQMGIFICFGLVVLAIPILVSTRVIAWRQAAVNLCALATGIILSITVMFGFINEKIVFRMNADKPVTMATQPEKPAKTADVIHIPAAGAGDAEMEAYAKKIRNLPHIPDLRFPGGLVERDTVRNGVHYTVRVPDYERDTRVCIDDRSDRLKLFGHAWLLYQQMPNIWGWGDEAYDMPLTRFSMLSRHLYPHNIILEVLVTRGPIVLLLFLSLVYAALVRSIMDTIRAPETAPFVLTMLYVLMSSLWSGDYFDFRWFFMLAVPVMMRKEKII